MRRSLLRNIVRPYTGLLGIPTEKGQQNNYPLVLDAPTESYELMLLRWQTGVFEVGAPQPVPQNSASSNLLILQNGSQVILRDGTPYILRQEL